NTRAVLRRYAELGALDRPPARRVIQDCVFDFQPGTGEREVYEAITAYIDRRYAELEREKRGKGFVMTVYRRRAASSLEALRKSLARRADGLRAVAAQHTVATALLDDEAPDTRSLDDLRDDATTTISAAYPSTPAAARRELEEVERLLDQLSALGGIDSKRDRFYDVLGDIASDGRPVLVFSEYLDTVTYLRDQLVGDYGTRLGCFTGDGGQRWDGASWRSVTKEAIAEALATGKLAVLICTDAASEGLNLQAAGALINYDLPWNPSKVEQRIGRIDRIGQQYDTVRIVNLFLKDSVDERIYTKLRERCGLFREFVGPMQPVLARARRMILGEEPLDLAALDQLADRIADDVLLDAAYWVEDPAQQAESPSPVTRNDLRQALAELTADLGVRATPQDEGQNLWTIRGNTLGSKCVALSPAAAESERSAVPLTPLAPIV
ncbi:MAG: DEAD/DEAH box helicase, partial [Dehalococcoidia bacterium]|nr:DEAD/DEAH box helicase [Dehalococcoidia bacterium]